MRHAPSHNKLNIASLAVTALTAIVCLLTASQVAAQTASSSTPSAPGGDVLEEVTVTARKRAESLITVPESISVFTSQMIEDARVRKIDDVIAMTPSFEILHQESAGVFQMSIRGVTQTNQGDAPVTMVVDGVTLPYANSFGKPLFDIQQIEVLKGPQGALYGQNAIGGAVLVTTKQATDQLEGHVTASYGNYNHAEFVAALSGPIVANKVLFRLSGYANHDDGDTTYAFFPSRKYSRLNTQALRGDLTFNFTDRFSVVLGADLGYTGWGAQPLVPETLSAGSGIPGVTVDQINANIVLGKPSQSDPNLPRTTQHYWDVSTKLDYRGSIGTLSAVSSYQVVREYETQDLDVSGIPFVWGKLNNLIDAFSQEVRFTSPSNQPLRWVLGGFYQHVTRGYDINPVYINVNLLRTGDISREDALYVPFAATLQAQTLDSYAIFGQADYDLTEALQLTVGGRYDRDPRKNVTTGYAPGNVPLFLSQEKTFTQFQPKGSLRYMFNPSASGYFTVARGFRSGGFNSGANANVQPAFPAETTTTYEIGTKLSLLERRLNLSAATFYTDYKNQQLSLITVSTSGTFQDNFTVEKTQIKGVELELQAIPFHGLELSAGVDYLDATIKKFGNSLSGSQFDPSAYIGKKVPLVTRYGASGAVQYTHTLTQALDGIFRTDIQYKGPLYWEPDNRVRRSPYTLVNVSGTVKADRWELRVYGTNVFNKRYVIQYFDNTFVNAPGGFDFAALSNRVRFGLEGSWHF
jgi:iron complex outermembrane receptor protein